MIHDDRNGERLEETPREAPDGWTEPRSPGVPSPTFWPAVTALSVVALFFGFLTSWVISAVGLILFAYSIKEWMGELARDI